MMRPTLLAALLVCLIASPASARPAHKRALADRFGPLLAKKLNDCRTCHLADGDEDEKPHNAFGLRLKAVRNELRKKGEKSGIVNRLDAIADEDSDGDGASNFLELLAGRFPGEADDTPTSDELSKAKLAYVAFRNADGPSWSPFEALKRPDVPDSTHGNAIDAFLAADRAKLKLPARPEADRATLLRRVTVDLTGLPPTPAELHAFLNDASPNAYEAVVDRLLASPSHGERWGRHWMDVWRYSDWAGWGAQVRDSQPHIWRWRDWIVESLNADKPYDRMIVEMLAADEVAPEDESALRATGYLVRNFKLLSREKWMQDVVDHTGQAFLGVTIGCARCHDHMYDPITQKDYYRMRAIFEPHQVRIDKVPGEVDIAKNGLARAYDANLDVKTFLFIRGDERTPSKETLAPGVPESLGGAWSPAAAVTLPKTAVAPDRRDFVADDAIAAADEAVRKALAAQLVAKGDDAESATAALTLAVAKHAELVAVTHAERLAEKDGKDTEKWREAATRALVAQRARHLAEARSLEIAARNARRNAPPAGRAEADRAAASAIRAIYNLEAAFTAPASTAYEPPKPTMYPATSTGRRAALAKWIASRDNPLTARVAVNHIWGRHFGRAIVPSTNDFGRNGQPATHPHLLDWLASEFVERGWSMKAIHRLIVTSEAYRMASTPDAAAVAIDPDNIHLWRFSPRRIEAEAVRDAVLAVSGDLDTTRGGPEIDHALGLTSRRKSLYFRHAAEKQMEFLKIFDAAGVTECYQRRDSILPQQALALSNSELALRESRRLARTLAAADAASFAKAAFEKVLCRPPTDKELAECTAYLGNLISPMPSPDDPKPAAEPSARLRESLVHVLMNHHEFVTLR